MSLIRWEPFREFDDLLRRYAPVYARGANHGLAEVADWSPAANITETAKEYLIKAELPEINKDDVRVTFEKGVITISGERKQMKEDKDEVSLRVESVYGVFSRSFSLPDNVDEAGIYADSKDGVLRVHIPKKAAETAKPLQIKVQ